MIRNPHKTSGRFLNKHFSVQEETERHLKYGEKITVNQEFYSCASETKEG